MYRYFLDGVLLQDEPIGWDQLITSLKRDRILKGIIKTIDTSLIFHGDGYDYLLNIYLINSFCSQSSLTIQKSCDGGNTYQTFYEGIIFVSDIEFDEKRCLAKCKIQDNSFYAKIYNNKSQEWLPFVGLSKNGGAISEAPIQSLGFFDPQSGIFYPILSGAGKERTCASYKIYDILKFAIAFMTDDTIDFDSITFGAGGDWEGIMLTSGMVCSTVQDGLDEPTFEQNFPKLTFEKIFLEIDRRINIGFYIDYTTPRPTLFIEADPLMKNSSVVLNTVNIDELKTTTAVDYLYSKLLIGNNIFNDDQLLHFPGDIDFVGFKSESYNILGKCNIDRQLDLSTDYIVDSNSIEAAVVGGDTANDNEIFLIRAVFYSGTTWSAIETNTLLGSPVPPYYYNEDFTNAEIAKRYLGSIPNSIAIYLGNADHKFQATKTDDLPQVGVFPTAVNTPIIIEPVKFQDDFSGTNFDATGNYDPSTNEYTIAQGGQYTFYSNLTIRFVYGGPANGTPIPFNIYLKEYDSSGFVGGNLLNSYLVAQVFPILTVNAVNIFSFFGSKTVNTAANNKFIISLEVDGLFTPFVTLAAAAVLHNSVFACTQSITGGGIYQTYDPDDYSVLLSSFQYPFNDSDYQNILANVRGQLQYNLKDKKSRVGWIETIKFNHFTNKMDIVLNSNKKLNGN